MKKILITSIFLIVLGSISILEKVDLKYNQISDNTTMIFDRKGELIRKLSLNGPEVKTHVSLSEIPKDMQELFLLSEDKRFYEHIGIDIWGLLRALKDNILSRRIVSGASTIEQQLVRLINHYPRKLYYKPVVILNAIYLSLTENKKNILEAYLNNIPFGHNITGLWEASQYFYGKEPSFLTLSEMASLAVIVRSPSRLVSKKYKEELISKRNDLLVRFEKRGELNKELLKLSLEEKNEFVYLKHGFYAPQFIRYILKDCPDCSKRPKIYTSIDLPLQQDIQSIVKETIQRLNEKNVSTASVLVADNKTGEILTYIGSHDFFSNQGGQIDGVQTKRQPGSTLKPFTYALAFQNDHHPSSILPDTDTNFNVGGGIYRPRNYSNKYLGPVRASFALANSLNIPALYLGDYYGPEAILNSYRSLGFELPLSPETYGIGLTLGNGEVSLFELVRAYSSLANGGVYPKFTGFKLIEKSPIFHSTFLRKGTTQIISKILSDDQRRSHSFGRYSDLSFPFQFASKTGTSTNYRDNWVVGYNTDFTVGVWAGNFNQESMHNVSGITGAGRIFNQVVKRVYRSFQNHDFKNNDTGLVEKRVCTLSGKLATKNCDKFLDEKFTSTNFPHENCDVHKTVKVKLCKNGELTSDVKVTDISDQFYYWKKFMHISSVKEQVSEQCKGGHILLGEGGHDIDHQIVDFKTPLEGSFYGIDPNIPRKFQKIGFELSSNLEIKKIEWILNDTTLGESERLNYFPWNVEKGNHKLKAKIHLKDNRVLTKQVSFHVL